MSELDTLLGQRDAALYREDMTRVAVLEARIAILATELRLKLARDCASELRGAIDAFKEDCREIGKRP